MNTTATVEVHGECLSDPAGPGGYAGRVSAPGGIRRLAGSHPGTCTERMALIAATQGLLALNELAGPGEGALLVTNSREIGWAINTGAARRWEDTGWLLPDGTDVANQDLWFRLLQAADGRELACAVRTDMDELAGTAAERARWARRQGGPVAEVLA